MNFGGDLHQVKISGCLLYQVMEVEWSPMLTGEGDTPDVDESVASIKLTDGLRLVELVDSIKSQTSRESILALLR